LQPSRRQKDKTAQLLFAFNKGDLYDLEVGIYVKQMVASLRVEKVGTKQ
jgi:hypothetical protein